MARTLRIPAHLTLDELEQRYRRTKDPVARSQWQILWLLSSGTSTAEVARVTRYSANWVREIARRYREDGPTGIGDRRHGNPGATPLLVWPQQEALRGLERPGPGRWVVDRPLGSGLDERGTGTGGQRPTRVGVDAPLGLHPATAPSPGNPR
jgi:hypothetical protein